MDKMLGKRLITVLGFGLVIMLTVAVGPVRADGMTAAYQSDVDAFMRIRTSLSVIVDHIKSRPDLFGARPKEDAFLLQPEVRQEIRFLWYQVLENYLALDVLCEQHTGLFLAGKKVAKKHSFHLSRGIFLAQYRLALEMIPRLEQNSLVDTILNEADPALGMPGRAYAHFKYQYLNVLKAGRYAAMEAVAAGYGKAPDPLLEKWAEEDSRVILAAGMGPGPLMTLENGVRMISHLGHQAWFPVQKGIALWMGQTKVHRQGTCLISEKQIKSLSEFLMPGDILLERREWYMTNVGIPGFWTHAAIYVGDAEKRNAFSKKPGVRAWLNQQGLQTIDGLIKKRFPDAHSALARPCEDGELPQVIESIAPGVSLTSLSHSAGCDSLAVLRPELPAADRAAAVVQAMSYYDRPYDYSFDFGSDDSLVCTELVVKAFLPGNDKQGLDLPMDSVMGKMVTPANAFARVFDRTMGTPGQQMALLAFFDGIEKENRAVRANVDTFRKSWRRPKWHILVQEAP